MSSVENPNPAVSVCQSSDLVESSGVCVILGNTQIALFYLPDERPPLYAISNWDPIGKSNVLSRGIVGDINGQLVVASPLYKQHFSLTDGHCIEDPQISVKSYRAYFIGREVMVGECEHPE